MADDPTPYPGAAGPAAGVGPLPRALRPAAYGGRRSYPRAAIATADNAPPARCPPVIIAEAIGEPGVGVWVLVPEESNDEVCSYAYAGGIV